MISYAVNDSELFLKYDVTLKTEVLADENVSMPSQE